LIFQIIKNPDHAFTLSWPLPHKKAKQLKTQAHICRKKEKGYSKKAGKPVSTFQFPQASTLPGDKHNNSNK